MKKKYILLIVIPLVAVIAIIWYATSTKWLDLNRKTYENERYGFSLKYPASWILGEGEYNNAGRTITSPDEGVMCYAYGFANSLLNDNGEPQTLNEFVDWLADTDADPSIKNVLYRGNSALSNQPAISLVLEMETNIKRAIYALGKETGVGFFCVYADEASMNDNVNQYIQIVNSFKINDDLGGKLVSGSQDCINLLNGTIIPFKDIQTFTDTNYTTVTTTSRTSWNKNKLPAMVPQLEGKGYTCYPMPLTFDDVAIDAGVNSVPVVTKVKWSCELKYGAYKYLSKDQSAQKSTLESRGYTCERESCLANGATPDSVWLCTK